MTGGIRSPQPDDAPDPALVDACGEEPSWLCEEVFDRTDGNEVASRLVDWLVGRPLTILAIVAAAWVISRVARRLVTRTVRRAVLSTGSVSALSGALINSRPHRLAQGVAARFGGEYGRAGDVGDPSPDDQPDRPPEDQPGGQPDRPPDDQPDGDGEHEIVEPASFPDVASRRAARADSISTVIGSSVTVLIWVVAAMLIVGELGIPLGPLIAGAGIGGIALGFGAQSLVKDCISGLFMLIEDQYGLGDVVDLGEAVGVVERITLRATVLRGIDGTVWHVPNGEVRRVGNKSQRWSVALVDVDVAYDSDLDHAEQVILAAAQRICESPAWRPTVLGEPELLGIEQLGADGIMLRTVVRTSPGAQWALQRALRAEYKSALDAAGIEIPFPQRTVWMRSDERPDGPPNGRLDGAPPGQ